MALMLGTVAAASSILGKHWMVPAPKLERSRYPTREPGLVIKKPNPALALEGLMVTFVTFTNATVMVLHPVDPGQPLKDIPAFIASE